MGNFLSGDEQGKCGPCTEPKQDQPLSTNNTKVHPVPQNPTDPKDSKDSKDFQDFQNFQKAEQIRLKQKIEEEKAKAAKQAQEADAERARQAEIDRRNRNAERWLHAHDAKIKAKRDEEDARVSALAIHKFHQGGGPTRWSAFGNSMPKTSDGHQPIHIRYVPGNLFTPGRHEAVAVSRNSMPPVPLRNL